MKTEITMYMTTISTLSESILIVAILIVEGTSVADLMMRMRLKHTLGFISFVAVYAPTDTWETEEK